ncbi:hypothetical protein ACS0TY_036881 [Phlomoides rotata]
MVLMERTEHTLVPEWLRCTGNVVGGGTSTRNSEDVTSSAHPTRSRSLRSNGEKDSSRLLNGSSFCDSRHSSSSNGSAKHPYSSFTRSHRDRNRVRVKDKFLPEDIWDHSSSDPLASLLTGRFDKSALRRSQSLISRKPSEVLPGRVEDSRGSIDRQSNSNGVLSRGSKSSGIQKPFEKEFPSLGTEEKQDTTGIRRVLSPGSSSSIQSLPIGNSGFLGGEKWTSALAEVPTILANNSTSHSSLQQNVVMCANSASGTSCAAGLNMAEALSHPPARAGVTPQLPDKSQRLEELAIKQSRQLIPMTPAMPKPLGLNSGDKSRKPKIGVRTNEVTAASKGAQAQPHSSHLSNQSRAIPVRADSSSTSHIGKFLVLKPGRENAVTVVAKDVSAPNSDADCRMLNGQHVTAPSAPTASMSLNKSAVENKVASLSLSPKSTGERRSSQSLAQSRSEFFNLMRRKTKPNVKTTLSNPGLPVSSPSAQTSGEISNGSHDNDNQMVCNDKENLICNGQTFPDEEEAAFLRSLGWEENGGEDEGLTEEEINAFYQEVSIFRSSSLLVWHATGSVRS